MAPDRSTPGLVSPDEALRARALKVIPGGMWGHMNVARLPPGYPQFFRSASGCRLRDAAGTEYVDLMCGYGPIVLHPLVGGMPIEEAWKAVQLLTDVVLPALG